MARIQLISWLSLMTAAGPLLANCAEQPKPSYVGHIGSANELVLQDCRGEVAIAQVSEAAPPDVRAELAQGVMASCMAKKGFYLE